MSDPANVPTVSAYRTVTFWSILIAALASVWQAAGWHLDWLGKFNDTAPIVIQLFSAFGAIYGHVSAPARRVSLRFTSRPKQLPILLMGCLLFVGCSADQNRTVIYQSALADDAAVLSTTQLVQAGTVTAPDGYKVYVGAKTARDAIVIANNARLAGDQPTLQTSLATLSSAITVVNSDLKLIQKNYASSTISTNKKQGVSEVIAIIQLAEVLAPIVQSWISNAYDQQITDAKISAAIQILDGDLTVLGGLTAPTTAQRYRILNPRK